MKSRSEIQAQFVKRFASRFNEPARVTVAAIFKLERELKSRLPVAYRDFILTFGAIHTPAILDEVADRELEHPDIQDFFTPKEAITTNKGYWSGGMPDDIVGIASDCMGNMIGFRRSEKECDDAAVMFFDHDYVTVSEIAPSFDALLEWYLQNLGEAKAPRKKKRK